MFKRKELLVTVFVFFVTSFVHALDFVEESEKDYSLRSIGQLQIKNVKGDITVQGWALDKIRIKIKKKVQVELPDEAKKKFDLAGYRYNASEGVIEISSEYGKEMSIEERLNEKEHKSVSLDMMIFAPSNLKLSIWSVDSKVLLKSWNSEVEIRSNNGSVQVEGVKGEKLALVCPSCSAKIKNVRASVSLKGGDKEFDLKQVDGKSIYVETESGPIKLYHIQGEQLYISKTGAIEGQFLSGQLQFQAQQGHIVFRDIVGFLNGTTESGNITATVTEWEVTDRSLIESNHGDISITFPRRFSGDFDLWSVHGEIKLGFPWEKTQQRENKEPSLSNHLTGRIGEGGGLLKITSESGKITVDRKNL